MTPRDIWSVFAGRRELGAMRHHCAAPSGIQWVGDDGGYCEECVPMFFLADTGCI